MRLFALRHGNTFGPDQAGGERIFMAGCQQNIPLVNTGRVQARTFAQYLIRQDILPTAIYANHLLRTWESACVINEYFVRHGVESLPLYQDEHLLELDYGQWAGLNTRGQTKDDNEVIARFGQAAWDDWQLRRIMPSGAPHHWQIKEEEVIAGLEDFLSHLVDNFNADDVIVAIGSQGVLGYLNALLPGGMAAAIEAGRYKIKTGHFCELEYQQKEWQLVHWNQNPGDATTESSAISLKYE